MLFEEFSEKIKKTLEKLEIEKNKLATSPIVPELAKVEAFLNNDKLKELYGLSKGEYICTVSRLTAEKGIHYLIDAYNNIKTDKRIFLIIVFV